MKVLFLGYADSPLIGFLRSRGHQVRVETERLKVDQLLDEEVLVSYGYRYIIKPALLARFPNRAFNLHIALLPWNKGAHPVFWSVFENTPAGVTIHLLDEGIDTGALVAQKAVALDETETLESAYQKHRLEIEELFREIWPVIESGEFQAVRQSGQGSVHRGSDLEKVFPSLSEGWKTSLAEVRRVGRECKH